jgi:hypothetical protein
MWSIQVLQLTEALCLDQNMHQNICDLVFSYFSNKKYIVIYQMLEEMKAH